ncbi:hypothetical protein ACFV1H_17885 [Streptomyces virginiae]|uniref:hypothetical protein n=1 Tax=Streptomyces virginiae TaxID=1961 RepID=UPI0036C4ACDF
MPIRPENHAPGDYLAEPLDAFLGADELAALELVRAKLGVDATRTYQFWESSVARLLDGRLTSHKCPWDVELPYGTHRIRVEVKYAQESWCRFRAGERAVFKFAAPKGAQPSEKPAEVIVLMGIDANANAHAWAVPSHVIRRCPSITLTSPRFRTGTSRSRGVDLYRCPPTQLLPEVLRAYRERLTPHHAETRARTRRAAAEAAGQLTLEQRPMSRFEYRDASGDKLVALPAKDGILIEAECAPFIPLDRIEEVIAGLRDMARQAGGQPAARCENANCAGSCPGCYVEPARTARRRLNELEHDRAWHAIEGLDWETADPDTVLNAVLRALRIDPPVVAAVEGAGA